MARGAADYRADRFVRPKDSSRPANTHQDAIVPADSGPPILRSQTLLPASDRLLGSGSGRRPAAPSIAWWSELSAGVRRENQIRRPRFRVIAHGSASGHAIRAHSPAARKRAKACRDVRAWRVE